MGYLSGISGVFTNSETLKVTKNIQGLTKLLFEEDAMFNRIIGVFKLDVKTFEDIEHDETATGQAAIVVALVALLAGVGSGLGAQIGEGSFLKSFLFTLVWAFVGWFLWSAVSYFVGTRLFGGQATLNEMLRVIGYAQAPQLLGIIPCIGGLVGAIWALIAGFIAIRQGLDLDNTKAFLTALIGFGVLIVGYIIIGLFLAPVGALLTGG